MVCTNDSAGAAGGIVFQHIARGYDWIGILLSKVNTNDLTAGAASGRVIARGYDWRRSRIFKVGTNDPAYTPGD